MLEPRDETLERVLRELRRLPPSDPVAVQSIVAAVEHRAMHRRSTGPDLMALWRTPRVSTAAAAALVFAAGVGGFVLRGSTRPDTPRVVLSPEPPPPIDASATPVRNAAQLSADASERQQTQFVLESSTARQVALVGSFNDWNANATPLVRDADGVWSVTVPLTVGRHRYAFIVNDSVWTLDPRALRAPDGDFGVESSVLIVGRP